MHSNSPIPETEESCLYVVATPIGNLADITIRALKILAEVDCIAAEDTRRTGKLLAFYNIKTPMLAYHEHNEHRFTPRLIDRLRRGQSLALVSDAGTPLVSDPGYFLITAAIAADIRVVPVPGASAGIAALSVSGLATDAFLFIGFPAKKKARRLSQLSKLAHTRQTLILFESPKRVLNLIAEIMTVMGDRRGVLAREMTKHHEEIFRGRLSEIALRLEQNAMLKGECTLVLEGADADETVSMAMVRQEIKQALAGTSKPVSQIVREIARKYKLSKNRLYRDALEQGFIKSRKRDI